jgi:autotransporter-associated beta strand protein
LAGTNALSKTTGNTVTLSGANTYTGATNINAGTLAIASGGDIAGDVNNNNGGTLDVGSNTLDIAGKTYTQATGSALDVTVASLSASGKVKSTVAASVSKDSTVNVAISDSLYVPSNTIFTIIEGGAAIAGTGAPTTVNAPNGSRVAFLSSVSGNNLILTANRSASGFASLAASGDSNASAVGTVLDNITSPSSDMTTVLNTLEGLNNTQTASALNTMVPEVDAGVFNNTAASLNNFVGASLERVRTVFNIAQNPDRSAKTGISAGDETKLNGIWAKGYGSYLTQGTRKGIQGYDAWNAGTAIGVDRLFRDVFTLGIAGGYAYGNVDSDVNNGNTYINSGQTTIYGGYQDANYPFYIDAAGSFAWNWYNGKRDIAVGAISRTANAEYDGQQYGAYIGGGYKFDLTKNLEFTPLASLQYSRLHLASYTETEAGALNLSVASQDYDLLQSGLGARVAYPVRFDWGTFTPEAHGKWLYDFIGDDMVMTSTFTGGGASFNSNGAKPAQNSFNIGGKLTLDLKNDVSVIGECDTELKDEFFGIYGAVTLRYAF